MRRLADEPGLVNCYRRHTHLVAYWVPHVSGRALNWMWYRNVPAHELDDFLSDDAGRVHRWSLPPGSMPCDSRQDLLEEMRDIFPESVFRAAQAARNFSQQPIYRGVPPTMRRGRVILIGDAAHVAVPHIGAGISLAVRDTTELVRFLESRQRGCRNRGVGGLAARDRRTQPESGV